MISSVLLLALGVAVLYLGAEWLIRGAVRLGTRLGVTPIMVGLTVVSIGTSAPELVVSVVASLRGTPDLAMGNVLGSNLANVGLVLGLAALIRPLAVAESVVRRDLPWMVAVTLVAFLLIWNLEVGRLEGMAFALVLLIYLGVLFRQWKGQGSTGPLKLPVPGVGVPGAGGSPRGEAASSTVGLQGPWWEGGRVALGIVGLVAGGQLIVAGGTDLATWLGVSELVIGLSVVAVGTSLPELATTVVAAARKEVDLAVGNIVGSNIFNLTFVLGGTALVQPMAVAERILRVEYPAVLLISLLLVPLALHGRELGRLKGAILLAAYVGIWVWIQSVG